MVRFGWGDDEKRYWVMSFERTWSCKELSQALDEMLEAVSSEHQKISLVIDLRYSANPPTKILNILRNPNYHHPSRVKHVTVISNRPIWKKVYNAFQSIYPSNHYNVLFVETVDEAYRRLADEVYA